MQRRKLASLLLAIVPGLTLAADGKYPDRPIRMIVPYAAGGGTDTVARIVMRKVSEQMGQPIIVENKPGAGGAIAYTEVVRSKPDGYTLTVGSAQVPVMGLIYGSLQFDPIKDLVPVAPMANVPIALVSNISAPYKNVAELLAFSRANTRTPLAYGTPGVSTPNHLSGVLLASMTGLQFEHVPYKGTAPAIQDVVGGVVPLAIVGLSTAVNFADSGRIRILGVGAGKRSPLAPTVPTIAEGGVKGYEASYWYDVSAASGTPAPILERLHAEISKAVQSPEVQDQLRKDGFEPMQMSRAELLAAMKEQSAKWGKVIRNNNIRISN